MRPIEFTKIMKTLTMSYSKEFDEEMLQVWYMHFKDIKKEVLYKAVMEEIKTKKFMPSIAELLEECEKQKSNIKYAILEEMKKDGYFKTEYEYEKTAKFMEEGIIPEWLKKDMKKYQRELLENKLLLN